MGQRTLLVVGLGAIAASLLIGVVGFRTGLGSGNGGSIGIDRAVKVAQDTAAAYPGARLEVDEVIEFSQNYYASIRETATGIGAFEILIGRSTGAVNREPGPDMMWNTKYSGMRRGGMMGGGYYASGAPSISADQVKRIAQGWLDSNRPGSTANSPDPFYGYYTVDFTSSGQLAGMLSVNAYSGQVWYHSWHGEFIQSREVAG